MIRALRPSRLHHAYSPRRHLAAPGGVGANECEAAKPRLYSVWIVCGQVLNSIPQQQDYKARRLKLRQQLARTEAPHGVAKLV